MGFVIWDLGWSDSGACSFFPGQFRSPALRHCSDQQGSPARRQDGRSRVASTANQPSKSPQHTQRELQQL